MMSQQIGEAPLFRSGLAPSDEFSQRIDEGDGQDVGDEHGRHRLKEGNCSCGILYHDGGFYGSQLELGAGSGAVADTSNFKSRSLA